LANGKTPPVFPTSEKLFLNVEGLNDARTLHGKRRVSARRGRAGEKSDFFSILLDRMTDLLDRQPDDKTAAGRGVRFDPHPPAETLDNMPHDRQPEPCST
jgi:hypothetical protein